MPISSGPSGLTRAYQYAPQDGSKAATWNQPGAHNTEPVSSLRSLPRPAGSGVSREVAVLFGHAQLIPTYTLHPEEEERGAPEHEWLDPSQSPAPRDTAVSQEAHARRQHSRASAARAHGEGDTIDRLGLGQPSQAWQGGVIKQAERHKPMTTSTRGTQRSSSRPATAGARRPSRSRSPSVGRPALSPRPPLHLSSSVLTPLSSARGRSRERDMRGEGTRSSLANDAAEGGQFRSPHATDMGKARQYITKLDKELAENARMALEDEKQARQESERMSASARAAHARKEAEWNRDLMIGLHVRTHNIERKWHEGAGMDRIAALYDPQRDANMSSTQILRSSGTSQLYDPDVSSSGLLNRSTVLHSPPSGSALHNISVAGSRELEPAGPSLPDKSVDLGFAASGTRKHEEAHGGKQLLKSQAWPRDPVAAAAQEVRGGSDRSSARERGGVNTSTSSARVRAQEAGELNYDLSASFGPGANRTAQRSRPASATGTPQGSARNRSSFQLLDSQTGSWHASSSASASPPATTKRLRPAGGHPHQEASSSRLGSLSPNPLSVTNVPRDFVGGAEQNQSSSSSMRQHNNNTLSHTTTTASAPSFHSNPSLTAASAHAQQAHASKFDATTGSLRGAHPRDFADSFLAGQGIAVASGQGGLDESGRGGASNSLNMTGASMQAPAHTLHQHIEGNGSILDLSGALARRQKAPWKFGGETRTRKHDRKIKDTEDIVLEEARKKRLPSSSSQRRPASAGHAHAHAHRSGHALADGHAQFLTTPTTLKPSLHLHSGRNILGKTRVSRRVDLTERDWAYVKRREKEARAEAYAQAKQGPTDPKPHHTSVIEEAQALERAARRERAMVAREREWRAQQIWLHEKKLGMDKLAARAKAATRSMPPRPRRPPPPQDDVSAGGSGLAKSWQGPLIVPQYLSSTERVIRDIDTAAEVRGRDRLAAHAKAQIAAHKGKGAAASASFDPASGPDASHRIEDEYATSMHEDEWPSKHHLSQGEQLTNPLDDSTGQYEEAMGGDGGRYEQRAAAASGEYALDELELEELRRRTRSLDGGLARRDRNELEREDAREVARLAEEAERLRQGQDWRERAAERAISGAKGAPGARAVAGSASNSRADVLDSNSWAAQRDAEERAQAAQRTAGLARRRESAAASTSHGSSSNRIHAMLSFTAPPTDSEDSESPAARRSSASVSKPGVGESALSAARLYDRRLNEMIAFLRVRQPYWSEAQRRERASVKAHELVAEELRRMGPRGGEVKAGGVGGGSAGADWYSEYEAAFVRGQDAAESYSASRSYGRDGASTAHKYQSRADTAAASSSGDDRYGDVESDSADTVRVRISARSNPFASDSRASPLTDEQRLEELRRAKDDITERYERMRQQATEAHSVR